MLLRQAADSAAQETGVRLVRAPANFEDLEDADIATLIPTGPGHAFFIGPLLRPATYGRLTNIVARADWEPFNSAESMIATTRLDHWYPLLADVTAKTVVAENQEDCDHAAAEIGLPAFVRGMVKSRKEAGWDACVVRDLATLKRWQAVAGPRIAVRELLSLRTSGRTLQNMPRTREYRAYVVDGVAIGLSYYWSERDPWGALTDTERSSIVELCRLVAERIPARLIGVDVGQLDDGHWVVIELNDPQFTGLAHMPRHIFWKQLIATENQVIE